MSDLAGYGFTYDPGSSGYSPLGGSAGGEGSVADAARLVQQATELFAWQVAVMHAESNALEDADNYPDYLMNRTRVTQALGVGMSQGQNAFPFDGQMFVVAVSVQNVEGGIDLISDAHPRYPDVALIVSQQLLRGDDHGMVAQLPDGALVPFVPPSATGGSSAFGASSV